MKFVQIEDSPYFDQVTFPKNYLTTNTKFSFIGQVRVNEKQWGVIYALDSGFGYKQKVQIVCDNIEMK